MTSLFDISLIVHILAGSLSFIVAPVALIVRKGGNAHRFWGKIFFWAMIVVCITAWIMSSIKSNRFMFMVGVFSFYLVFSGYRSLFRKKLYQTGKVALIDWIVSIGTLLFGGWLLFIGIVAIPQGLAYVALAFGVIAVLLSISDIRNFIKPKADKNQWFFNHLTGMVAAYIAALSAFSVVNLDFEWMPVVVLWLWPSMAGIPLMIIWTRYYRRKFDKGRKIAELAEVKIQTEESLS
ncbi:MAG: hypothetical protein DWQ44_02600 [Bacteroidetes bacterium]|nr:MAG: hypothetical protein DWQ33_06330 [Bacteroidota bacterium]REK04860.1 MAG: hypothetical protein DWQ39_06495 [Bacteroidota bacterium]REK36332.1 MAG: hypothetical protein DWQ44_02600 [Bacteroidota bacterium]REK51002.1 MAG: hypothetical protein DWQ48_02620 [Bacteroidota bacterium]